MDYISGNDYLISKLTEINKKYETNSFIDIDFVELFNLQTLRETIDIEIIKKKLTSKYHNLILKYHPDKFINNGDNIIEVNNIYIYIDDIKLGYFLSFISDIYDMLIYILKNNLDDLIDLINGEIKNKSFDDLKNNQKDIYIKEDISIDDYKIFTDLELIELKKNFNNEKINNINKLIEDENNKRKTIVIEKIFTDEQKKESEFNSLFNSKFIEKNINNNKNKESTNILLYSSNNLNNMKNHFCNLDEAFILQNINLDKHKNNITYDEYIKERLNK
jgi:hypothetical protein